MYKFSIAPSDFLAPNFEDKLRLCERTGCAYVELSDIVGGLFLGDMSGEVIEAMRDLLIDYGKTISLVTYTGAVSDTERFKKLLRTAHLLRVKAIKIECSGYDSMDALIADVNIPAAFAFCYGIDLCIENLHDSILAKNADLEKLIKGIEKPVKVIFNPLSFAYMRAHPFFHEFYGSRLKNQIEFLRINDGLYCERRPTMPACGNAEIKELASILLSRSFNGYFSFTDYFGGKMSESELLEVITTFHTLLKQM